MGGGRDGGQRVGANLTLCRQHSPYPPLRPWAPPPTASTSLQTLRIKQGLELFPWNFLRETKKVMPKSTFKVSALDIFIQSVRQKCCLSALSGSKKHHLKLAKLGSPGYFYTLIKHLSSCRIFPRPPPCRLTHSGGFSNKATEQGRPLSSSCLGVSTSLVRNILHLFAHLNFKSSKQRFKQKLKILTSLRDQGPVK